MRLRTFVRYTIGLGAIAVSVAAGVAISRRGCEQAGGADVSATDAEKPVAAEPPAPVPQAGDGRQPASTSR